MSELEEEVNQLKRTRAKMSRLFLLLLGLDIGVMLLWFVIEYYLPRVGR